MTSPAVAVVTDSTSYLPAGAASEHGIEVVPVQVVVDGVCHDDGVISSAEVADALRSWAIVTTSRPSPERFAAAYERAADLGALGIVSVHLSADMSGTYDCALLAAKTSPIPVVVVDSRTIAMALGFAALAAADAASSGGSLDDVAAVARDRAGSSTALFYVDTLEFLRRGGRIGPGQALLGQAMAVKPILTVRGGRVAPLEKVRTASKAIARVADLAAIAAGDRPVDIAVQHLDARDRATALAQRLIATLPQARITVSEVGAVVGAHVGPGMVGVVVAPR